MSHWAHTEALPIYGPYSSEIDSNIHCVDQSTTLILDLYFHYSPREQRRLEQ